jgi:hypothetical protein
MTGSSWAVGPTATIVDRWRSTHGLAKGAFGPERESFQAHRLFTGRLSALALPLGSLWLHWERTHRRAALR